MTFFKLNFFSPCSCATNGPRQVAPLCAPWSVKREIAFQGCQSPRAPPENPPSPSQTISKGISNQPTNQPTCRHKNLCTHTTTANGKPNRRSRTMCRKGGCQGWRKGGLVEKCRQTAVDSRQSWKCTTEQPKGIP